MAKRAFGSFSDDATQGLQNPGQLLQKISNKPVLQA